ncbi:hypothetical protein [Flavobacterium sp. J372]|uniref:hypothetical protein n=1 Tax=Flavobacterium sp. J372 TaxID=2898436 RepID=UPI0027E2A4EF|nr:hypothetical protein [Flavobacterium sp. J372]
MPMAIRELADTFLTDPRCGRVAPASSTVERVKQQPKQVDKGDKRKLLHQLIRTKTRAVRKPGIYTYKARR